MAAIPSLVFTPGLVKNNSHFWHSGRHHYGHGNHGACDDIPKLSNFLPAGPVWCIYSGSFWQ